MMRHSSFCFFILFITIFSAPSCERYVNHPDWNPDAKKALNSFIRSERNQKERPYVVFDFDNTCSIFDVSVQLMAYQLETMCFNLDPEEFSIMANTGMETYPESLQESVLSQPRESTLTRRPRWVWIPSGRISPRTWDSCMRNFRNI